MSIPDYRSIDNGMLHPDYERPVTHCDRCKEDIYKGDAYYRLEAEIICPNCLEDWAEQYQDIAKQEDFYDV
jgi:formylmethanofuran dehydrogenase subunit E